MWITKLQFHDNIKEELVKSLLCGKELKNKFIRQVLLQHGRRI
jgi:hypothetical protein